MTDSNDVTLGELMITRRTLSNIIKKGTDLLGRNKLDDDQVLKLLAITDDVARIMPVLNDLIRQLGAGNE